MARFASFMVSEQPEECCTHTIAWSLTLHMVTVISYSSQHREVSVRQPALHQLERQSPFDTSHPGSSFKHVAQLLQPLIRIWTSSQSGWELFIPGLNRQKLRQKVLDLPSNNMRGSQIKKLLPGWPSVVLLWTQMGERLEKKNPSRLSGYSQVL